MRDPLPIGGRHSGLSGGPGRRGKRAILLVSNKAAGSHLRETRRCRPRGLSARWTNARTTLRVFYRRWVGRQSCFWLGVHGNTVFSELPRARACKEDPQDERWTGRLILPARLYGSHGRKRNGWTRGAVNPGRHRRRYGAANSAEL